MRRRSGSNSRQASADVAPGPKRTFIPTPSAALQLLQTGHSLRVLDFFSV